MIEETFRRFPLEGKKDIQEMADSVIRFTPAMRFVLSDEEKRTFTVERKIVFFGLTEDWEFLDGPGDLGALAGRYLDHLANDSFYELF